MSYGVNSIQIHKKLRLDKRAGSDNWYARLTLPSGKRLIKTTKTDCLSPLELYQYFLAKGVRKHGPEALF